MAHSETNTTTNFVNVHVGCSFELHTVLVYTISSKHGLWIILKPNEYMGMSIYQSRNNTTTYVSLNYPNPTRSINLLFEMTVFELL